MYPSHSLIFSLQKISIQPGQIYPSLFFDIQKIADIHSARVDISSSIFDIQLVEDIHSTTVDISISFLDIQLVANIHINQVDVSISFFVEDIHSSRVDISFLFFISSKQQISIQAMFKLSFTFFFIQLVVGIHPNPVVIFISFFDIHLDILLYLVDIFLYLVDIRLYLLDICLYPVDINLNLMQVSILSIIAIQWIFA